MNQSKWVVIISLFLLLSNLLIPAPHESQPKKSLGEQLVRELWADMKANNIEVLENKIAHGFQSIHQDGARGFEQELVLLEKLNLGKYELSKFKVTQTGPVINVTYFVSVEETIKGKRLSTKPAPRLSVFLKTDQGWQWISHANLNPLK